VLRLLRTLHAWLGIFIFPWVIVIGATGFYLNHPKTVLSALEGSGYAESQFDAWPDRRPVTEASARAVARSVWPTELVEAVKEVTYHDRSAIEVSMPSGKVIVTRPTGHYFVKTSLTRRTYTPEGTLLDSKIYWGAVFKRLHVRGWFDSSLGTLLADLTSLAMVVFGLSGVVLWWMPRSRRLLRLLSRTG